MDGNKLKTLKAVGWKPAKSCFSCINGAFGSLGNRWGLCMLLEYEHGKHTDTKNIPAHKMSVCSKWEPGADYIDLQAWLKSEVTS